MFFGRFFPSLLSSCCMFSLLAACDGYSQRQANGHGATPFGVESSPISFKRLTVVVDTPKGIVTGHSVSAAVTSCGPSLSGNQCVISQSAEATAVDLPNGKTLYALLSRKGDREWTVMAPPIAWRKNGPDAQNLHYKVGWFPDFVMFRDEDDPKSVYFIDPDETFDDQYKIMDVYLTKVEGPRTRQIPRRLHWMPGLIGSLSGKAMAMNNAKDPAGRLGRTNFMKDELNAE